MGCDAQLAQNGSGKCPDLHAGEQVSTCSGYALISTRTHTQ